MKTAGARRGVGLVEVVVAAMLASTVLGLVWPLFCGLLTSSQHSEDRLFDVASLLVLRGHLEGEILSCADVRVIEDGSALELVAAGGGLAAPAPVRFHFEPSRGHLLREGKKISQARLESVHFRMSEEDGRRWIDVSLSVRDREVRAPGLASRAYQLRLSAPAQEAAKLHSLDWMAGRERP